jgi:D-glycero-D-manno-heptose 1,7-bisphosphate phosphatase
MVKSQCDSGNRGDAAVFLDRDGVLSRPILRDGRGYAPCRVEDFELLPNIGKAVRRLKKAGYPVIVVTNQKDVGRGLISEATLEKMHARLREVAPVDEILTCTCIDDCPCYKPNPGMLESAAAQHELDLMKCVIVGDTWRDIGAGRAVGAKTILIDWGYTNQPYIEPDHTVANLSEAVSLILRC